MQFVVNVPNHFLDAMHRTPADFEREAKLAMAVKLFEMKRLSSGMAATLAGLDRLSFLAQLQAFGVAVIDLDEDELASDLHHA